MKENSRTAALIRLRPQIPAAEVMDNTHESERFQNQTIRPIIKFQHDLLLAIARNYFARNKNTYFKLVETQRAQYLATMLSKDTAFRNQLLGLVIGLFSTEEYLEYQLKSADLNRRIINIIKKRLLDELVDVPSSAPV